MGAVELLSVMSAQPTQHGAIRPPNCAAPAICQPGLQVIDMARQSIGPQFYCMGCMRYVHAGAPNVASSLDEWEAAAVRALARAFSNDGFGTTFRHDAVVACDWPNTILLQ